MPGWEEMHGVGEAVIKISAGPALFLSDTWVMLLDSAGDPAGLIRAT